MNYEKRPVNIKGWEMYQVDTNGNVYGKNGNKLKYSINHNGYCIVNFYHNNKRKGFSVHTLIAKTFLENKENKTQVNHKDGNKQNNNIDNLEFVTAKENIEHSIKILGNDNIGVNNPNSRKIFGYDKNTNELKFKFDCIADAARYFAVNNVNYRHIQNIIYCVANNKGKKSYKGYIWKYN